MATFYSIIRAVPDPIAGEFVNIGLVVFGDGKLRTEFISDWRRVECLANEDINYLQEFAREFERGARETMVGVTWPSFDAFPVEAALSENVLRQMVSEWGNSIQFSPIEVANMAPDEALEELIPIFLKVVHSPQKPVRDARHAGQVAEREVETAFARVLGSRRAKSLVLHRTRLAGKRYDKNRVDVAVANGAPYLVGKGLSFEIASTDQIEQQVSTTVLQLGDLRDRYTKLAIGIIAVPPSNTGKGSSRARGLYHDMERYGRNLDARILTDEEAAEWAETEATRLAPQFEYASMITNQSSPMEQ